MDASDAITVFARDIDVCGRYRGHELRSLIEYRLT